MAALRLAQMIGADQSTLEAAYAGAWASALDGAEIPISAFKDQILMIEKECAQIIGNNASHPMKADRTAEEETAWDENIALYEKALGKELLRGNDGEIVFPFETV